LHYHEINEINMKLIKKIIQKMPILEGDHVQVLGLDVHGMALSELGHLVERHVVQVEENDQVVELLVSSEGYGAILRRLDYAHNRSNCEQVDFSLGTAADN